MRKPLSKSMDLTGQRELWTFAAHLEPPQLQTSVI